MVAQQEKQAKSKEGRGALITCFVLFALYFINVILGKINISYSLKLPHVDILVEFLLLFGACVLLIIAALKRETT